MRRTATPVSFSRSAMTGPSVWPSYGLSCSALARSTNCQRSGGRGNRHLAGELVRRASLAFVNALHLRCVQRVDLGSPLTLLLVAHPMGEIEQRTKAILKPGITLDLTANVADDTAEPGAQEFEFSPDALELVGTPARSDRPN